MGDFQKTCSTNTPRNGPYTAGGRDIVDFRIKRPYVEICWSCFLHCARKRSYVEICWSCFLHSARMIYEKRAIFAIFRDFLRRKTVGQLHHGRLRYRAWYRWKACRKSFPTVLSSTSNIGVVQKIQWKNRRKSRAFGEGETLFLCEKSFAQRKKPHAVEATLSFNIRSIIFLKLRVARGMYTLLNPFNSRKTDENRALLRFLKVQFWAQKVNIQALNSKIHYVRVSSL